MIFWKIKSWTLSRLSQFSRYACRGLESWFLRASDIAIEAVDDARKFLKEGESVEALIVGQDRKNRIIGLSIKAKEIGEEAAVLDQYTSEPEPETYRTTLGDLLKEQLDSK